MKARKRSVSKLFRIGDISKLFNLSVSTLRHYEKTGLVEPEYIDSETGYRYYSTRQFEPLNTIRYLRALDMPLPEIADFLKNRDVEIIEEKLQKQKQEVAERIERLKLIERKIDNRLNQLKDAQSSNFNVVRLVESREMRMVILEDTLKLGKSFDMEPQIRKLEQSQAQGVVFLGKVGVGISKEHLTEEKYDAYDEVFLVLDDEDDFDGNVVSFSKTLCASVRFCGSHNEALEQYRRMKEYIDANELEISGFSREITLIDYGFTNDTEKFVTEISIPVKQRKSNIEFDSLLLKR